MNNPSVTILLGPGCARAAADAYEGAEVIVLPSTGARDLNDAAASTRADFLCLLNALTVTPRDWLSTLLDAFIRLPGTGAVGGVIVDEASLVVEAGGIVLDDGAIRPRGRGLPVGDRRCRFVADVDCVSDECLVVRTETFRKVGGVLEDYALPRYRTADLCSRIAALDLRVRVVPQVRVNQRNTQPHDPPQVTAEERADRERLANRWKAQVDHRAILPLTTGRPSASRQPAVIVWHFPRTPVWDRDSGSLRLRSMLIGLAQRRFHVVLVTPGESNPYLTELEGRGIETLQASSVNHAACLDMIRARRPIAAVFAHAESELCFGRAYRALSPETIRVLDTVDLHFLRALRQLTVKRGLSGEPRISPATLSDAAYAELSSAGRCDVTLVVSEFERDLLVRDLSFDPARVRLVSNSQVLSAHPRPFAERDGFVFLGGYRHSPNVDSILWIADRIWPLIRRRMPDASLHVFGSSMPDIVKALHDPDAGIIVEGFVADHRDAIGRVRAMLSPLLYGAGVKGKISGALAAGTVVVTNRIGAEGIDPRGEAVVLGEDPQEIADRAVQIHADEGDWTGRSQRGLAIVRDQFSPETQMDRLISAIEDARAARGRASHWSLVDRLLGDLGGPAGETRDPDGATRDLRWRVREQSRQLELQRTELRSLRQRTDQLRLALSQSASARLHALGRGRRRPSA